MINVLQDIQLTNPLLIAAWPGMGQVAMRAATHLKETLRAKLFAQLEPDDIFYQTEIGVQEGVISLPELPRGNFYFWENKLGGRDLIIFISELQPPPDKGVFYAERILDFASNLGVKEVMTFAALLTTIDYTAKPCVWLAATDKGIIAQFQMMKVKQLGSGQISGLNGLFLGIAKEKNLRGACLLSEIPFYATQIENPRASLVLLEVVEKYLSLIKVIDYTELAIAEKIFEEEIGRLLEFIKRPLEADDEEDPITSDDIEQIRKSLASQKKIPDSARRKIEELFNKAKDTPHLAMELKKKLDEWHVYSEYEDRFLQLFKEKEEKDNLNA